MKYLSLPLVLFMVFLLAGCNGSSEIPQEQEANDDSSQEIRPEPIVVRECGADPETLKTSEGIDFVRTPDTCFEELPDWTYEPHYIEINGLRQAYVDEGPADGEVILLLHGQPSWSYLYRKMIPVLVEGGYRVIAMDHIGMGRSDKPIDIEYYSYLRHSDRLERFIEELDLQNITIFVQDWGSLIGLRVAGLNMDRFARIAIGNGDLPVMPADTAIDFGIENPDQAAFIPFPYAAIPDQQTAFYDGCTLLLDEVMEVMGSEGFQAWAEYSMKGASFQAGEVVEALTWNSLSDAEEKAYNAPFPSRIYMAGPRTFPSLAQDLPGLNADAWDALSAFSGPLVTIWGSNDPGNLGRCDTQNKWICNVPGAAGQPHARLPESGHFLQDDQGPEIARRLVAFMRQDDSIAGNYQPDCNEEEKPVIELTKNMCEDPSLMESVLEVMKSGGNPEMFGGANEALVDSMVAAPTDGPFYMFNLIHYRDQAVYADGRETNLTGREANALYAPVEFLEAIGARPVFTTTVDNQIDGDDIHWDEVAIVEYPCPLAFFAMLAQPAFQERAIHKEAGVEKTIAIVTNLVPIPAPSDPDQSEAAFPPTDEDPAFDLIHVMDFHEIAQYEPGSDEPERTGREAWEMYQKSGSGASMDLGHYPTAILEVQGVFTGDERTWDQIQMVHMSSLEGFNALLENPTREAGKYHRKAALENNYSLITFPMLSAIPYADGSSPGGDSPLPINEDGVGTICTSDADCSATGGANKCLKDGSGPGFCTYEGCGTGECGGSYVCCHSCSSFVAAMLPFKESACFLDSMVGQLEASPVSCTCD